MVLDLEKDFPKLGLSAPAIAKPPTENDTHPKSLIPSKVPTKVPVQVLRLKDPSRPDPPLRKATNAHAEHRNVIASEIPRLANIGEMSLQDRQNLLIGPTWKIFVGDEIIFNIPRRLIMTVSKSAQILYMHDPNMNSILLSKDFTSPAPVLHLMNWLVEICKTFKPFHIRDRDTFMETLAVVRAARMLGMEKYIDHMVRFYDRYIQKELPQYDEITAIEAMALDEEDPLFRSLSHRLSMMRHKDLIPDPEEFDAYLAQHPMLAKQIAKVDEKFNAGRLEREAKRIQRDYKKAASSAKNAEDEKLRKEEELKEAVRRKLNGRKGDAGNIKVMTAEEARLLKRR